MKGELSIINIQKRGFAVPFALLIALILSIYAIVILNHIKETKPVLTKSVADVKAKFLIRGALQFILLKIKYCYPEFYQAVNDLRIDPWPSEYDWTDRTLRWNKFIDDFNFSQYSSHPQLKELSEVICVELKVFGKAPLPDTDPTSPILGHELLVIKLKSKADAGALEIKRVVMLERRIRL